MATNYDLLPQQGGIAGALTAMTPASLSQAQTAQQNISTPPASTPLPPATPTTTKGPPGVNEGSGFLPAPSVPAPPPAPPPASTPTPTPPATPVPDDRNVEQRLNGLIAGDSDYMKLAEQSGLRTANARGLQNSSIAAGAAQGAAIERALPIATVDAQLASAEKIASQDQAGQLSRLQLQLSSSAAQQDKDLAAQMSRLQTDAAAQMSRLQTQLSSADAQQKVAIQAQMDQLLATTQQHLTEMAAANGYDLGKMQTQSGLDIARDAAQAKNATDLAKVQGSIQSALQSQGNTEQIQRMGVDLSNQLSLQNSQLNNDLAKISAAGDQDIRHLVEAANQERVTLQQSIAAQDRDRMATAMVNIFQIEAQMRSSLLGNTNIPADERAAYEKSISSLGDPIRTYMNQLFGTSSTPTPAPTTPSALPATTPAALPDATPATAAPVITAPGTGGGLLAGAAQSNNMASLPASVLNGGVAAAPAPVTGGGNVATTPGGLIPNIDALTDQQRRQMGYALQ